MVNKIQLKKQLKKLTGCTLQKNSCCGTCFFSISETLNNDDWNALLIYRGQNTLKETNEWRAADKRKPLTKEMIKDSINKLWDFIK